MVRKKCIGLVQYTDLILIFSWGSNKKREYNLEKHTFQTRVAMVLNLNNSSTESTRNNFPILVEMHWINMYRVNHNFVERIQAAMNRDRAGIN
jgi:hypothetical protein